MKWSGTRYPEHGSIGYWILNPVTTAMKTIAMLGCVLWTVGMMPATAADGAAVYARKCSSCHGNDGSGNTKMGKKLKCRDLSNAGVQAKLSDAQIAKAIREGVKEGGKLRMKPIKGLGDADVAALVEYVRTLKK